MRFGFVHRLTTLGVAVLGVVALSLAALLGAAPIATGLGVLVALAIAIQVGRVVTRRGAAHDLQILVVALFHFVAATMLITGAPSGTAFVACFGAALVVAPIALALSHLRREVEGNHRQGARDRTSLPVDVVRILRSRRVVGRGFLIALRFDLPDLRERPARLVLRFRGTAFDTWDGRSWSRSGSPSAPMPELPRGRRIAMEREPFDPAVLFVPEHAVAVEITSPDSFLLPRGPEGERRFGGSLALRYDAWLAKDGVADVEPIGDRDRYLALPAGVTRRIGDLAHAWTDGLPTDAAKARAIEAHLRNDFIYDVASPSRGTRDPLDHFLFESRRGHCEFFATAMAIMLREVGIPSRDVTGFVGGAYNRFAGSYVVRQADAHAWVEAWIDGAGFQTFDPTPSATRGATPSTTRELFELLEHYDGRARERLVTSIASHRNALGGFVVLALVTAIASRVRRRRRAAAPAIAPKPVAATSLYADLEPALVAHGIARPPSRTPLRHAEELAKNRHPLGGEIMGLTTAYLEVRFGGRTFSDAQRADFARRVRRIRDDARQSATRA